MVMLEVAPDVIIVHNALPAGWTGEQRLDLHKLSRYKYFITHVALVEVLGGEVIVWDGLDDN